MGNITKEISTPVEPVGMWPYPFSRALSHTEWVLALLQTILINLASSGVGVLVVGLLILFFWSMGSGIHSSTVLQAEDGWHL